MTINLSKGQAPVSLAKAGAPLLAEMTWPAATDYDLYGAILMRDGRLIYVARFSADGVPTLPEFQGIRQTGDARRGVGTSTETLSMSLGEDVAAVVPVAYSAQSNGTGSFHTYRVSLAVDNGAGGRIEVSAENANRNSRIYTCVPAIIHNGDGQVWVEPVELYSAPNSENRPAVRFVDGRPTVIMDAGPRNHYK